jgi:transcriptional regulator with XRE-family HTH domain
MAPKRLPRGDALDHITERYKLDTPRHWANMAEDHANLDVSMMVYALRTAAGLTQAGLAKRVGTTASAISRLEDAQYRGHSMAMLRRIAAAVGMKVVVRFTPHEASPRPGWILDKSQKEAIKQAMVADRAADVPGPGRRPRRPRPARRSAKRAG